MCTTGCPTQDHASWGECVRAKGLTVAPLGESGETNKAWRADLDAYAKARANGLQPAGTTKRQADEAWRIADKAA